MLMIVFLVVLSIIVLLTLSAVVASFKVHTSFDSTIEERKKKRDKGSFDFISPASKLSPENNLYKLKLRSNFTKKTIWVYAVGPDAITTYREFMESFGDDTFTVVDIKAKY